MCAQLAAPVHAQGVLMQDLVLQDFCCVAHERGRGTWRRLDVFADDAGDRWRPVAQFCIAEVCGGCVRVLNSASRVRDFEMWGLGAGGHTCLEPGERKKD